MIYEAKMRRIDTGSGKRIVEEEAIFTTFSLSGPGMGMLGGTPPGLFALHFKYRFLNVFFMHGRGEERNR